MRSSDDLRFPPWDLTVAAVIPLVSLFTGLLAALLFRALQRANLLKR